MNETDIFIKAVLAVSSLLFISSLIAASLKRIKIPYTVALVILGIVLSFLEKNVEFFSFLDVLELTPEIVFYIFLPVLIFESAYNMKFVELKRNVFVISSLAVLSLLISAFIIAFLFSYLLGLVGIEFPFLVALLFGALISATDPIAVLAIFKELGVPKRLSLIFEGESLFNDGTAFIFFQIVLAFVLAGEVGSPVVSAISGASEFLYVILTSMIFGIAMGVLFSKVIEKVRNHFSVEITLTLILAHVTFIFAEHFLKSSGIIATVFAGMVIGNYGRSKISPSVREIMEKFWAYAAFVVNSLIFLLIGLSIKEINFSEFLLATLIGIFVVALARAISIFSVVPVLNKFTKFTKEEKVPFSWQVLLAWGSLRGALALSIALLLPDSFEYKDFILSLTLSIILFTLLIKATTIKALIKKFGVDKFSDEESFEMEEGFIFIDETIKEKLKNMFNQGVISEATYKKLEGKYSFLENESKKRMQELLKKSKNLSKDKILQILKRHALSMEKKILYDSFVNFDISESVYNKLNAKLDVQIDRLKRNEPQISGKDKFEIKPNILFTKILKWFNKRGLFVNFAKKREIRNLIERYRLIRARIIVSDKVISELKELKKKHVLLNDENVIDEIIEQYKKFKEMNLKEKEKIQKEHPKLVELIESLIANSASISIEKDLLEGLNKNGIISDATYSKVVEHLDELLNKKCQITKRYFAKTKNAKLSE